MVHDGEDLSITIDEKNIGMIFKFNISYFSKCRGCINPLDINPPKLSTPSSIIVYTPSRTAMGGVKVKPSLNLRWGVKS